MMSADVILKRNFAFPTETLDKSLGTPTSSKSHRAQQYARPIHHSRAPNDGVGSFPNVGFSISQGENTLRRKTPNGTLVAGYEGAAESSLPPQKHQLLPLNDGHTFKPIQSPAENGKWTFLQHQQLQHGGLAGWHGQPGMGWQSVHLAQPHHSGPVMDSMLHQVPGQHFYVQQFYGQTIPSVIQPSFQHLGPTASGGQTSGPYGPYWHDGTFVPYRPAALRDPRFYPHSAASFPGSLHSSQLVYQANTWQPHATSSARWTLSQGLGSYDVPFLGPPSNPLHAPTAPNIPLPGPAIPNEVRSKSTDHIADIMNYDNEDVLQAIESQFGPSSPSGRQREKVFAWALQQYRDLLTFIHQNRRQQQHDRHPHSHHPVVPRPSFFPKPPRPSTNVPPLPKKLPIRETDGPRSDREEPLQTRPSYSELASGHERNEPANEAFKSRAMSVWSPSGVQFHENEYQRRASHDQYRTRPQQSTFPAHTLDKNRTLRRSSGSSVSSIVSPAPQDNSPPSRAAVALRLMTNLCQETDWQWIDGMHLGGCLAYGLGSYHKALRWYTKVLEKDPKHLEATSNMAAALLALGQRSEAEKHWSKVVKVAPNHFEAVEHLVGLLCHDQRSKDAIKVIEYVEHRLRQPRGSDILKGSDRQSECSSSTASRSPCMSELSDKMAFDFDADGDRLSTETKENSGGSESGFGSSGFATSGCDNGRILALIHAKGNMLYGLGDHDGAARAFEDAVLIATGRRFTGIQGLTKHILNAVSSNVPPHHKHQGSLSTEPVLLTPDQALATAKLCFPYDGDLPGLRFVMGGPQSLARRAVISTTSNSLLSLAKIFQDGMSNPSRAAGVTPLVHGVRDILALYYLSLSLQPSPSTANNVGILLASVQQAASPIASPKKINIPGVAPGSGIALALQYYNYGLQLDQHHAHLYTNLGSLLKDIGQLDAAINMYERAVKCDSKFDIALANLANAVKDKGKISDAIVYYKRAVEVSPDFAEAVCGLANALNSVCSWQGRGGIAEDSGKRDRWHVDTNGMLRNAKHPGAVSSGWVKRVVDIVDKQLIDGENWGCGALTSPHIEKLVQQIAWLGASSKDSKVRERRIREILTTWAGTPGAGARVTRLVELATRRIGWIWYQDLYVNKKIRSQSSYDRPQLPTALTVPTAPTVLPFHTFTCPMTAKQIRLISQRNGLRISVSTLRSPWLSKQVYPPPKPPAPYLRVGYVSSDFNNHPLAHLMQSVFGMHDRSRVEAYCYATTASDNSIHRQQIQNEAPVFHNASTWSAERLIKQIVEDGIHILVNLNGYTRGARNEVFAARPAPIQMSFMGFAGTLGAEWCDYLLADETAVPPDTLRPRRKNADVVDQLVEENNDGDNDDWVYGENVIYCRDTFFCCDHKQSAPDVHEKRISWEEEQRTRWRMRKELFPQISDDFIIFGNFNQLYKVSSITYLTAPETTN